jgi:hypothetical protein
MLVKTQLFNQRLSYIKKKSPWFTPPSSKLLNILYSDKTLTPLELGSRTFLINDNINTNSNVGFKPIVPLTGTPESNSEFTFGEGQLGWYFMYGNQEDTAFTFMLFRVDVAPPVIVDKSILTPPEAELYSIVAGCGSSNGTWYTLPQTIVEGKYSYNNETGAISFQAINDDQSKLINCSFSSEGFNKGYNIDMKWNDQNKNNEIIINAKLIPTIPATYNAKDGCLGCIEGLGSPYWSYTRMESLASVGDTTIQGFKTGVGWFDHQWLESGILANPFLQLILNRVQSKTYTTSTRWVWLNLQLSNGINYMLTQFVKQPLKLNDLIDFPIANKYYPNGNVEYDLKNITAKILDVKTIKGTVFPSKYLITIGKEKYILKSDFGDGTVTMPSGTLNLEVAGSVFDIEEKQRLGNGFLEANQFQTDKEIITTVSKSGGISEDDANLFLDNKRPALVGAIPIVLLILVIIIVIFLLILLLKFLFKRKK